MRSLLLMALSAALLVGCGAPAIEAAREEAGGGALRLRHQIMVEYGSESQVFEGYMIWRGDAFYVKAFAGPGVDLFTVVRSGEWHREEAHIDALAERLDLEAVGADIARAYLDGCDDEEVAGLTRCDFHDEPLEETRDEFGRIAKRRFPEAHGIGLTVLYTDYAERSGEELAGKIELSWGEGANRMVIVLLDASRATGPVDDLLAP